MIRSQKFLVVSGLALAVWGMTYGLIYAVFIEHQTLDQIGGSLASAFVRAAERKLPESQAAMTAYADGNFAYVRQVDVHSHWIGLGMLLIVLGVAFERVGFPERTRYWLALSLVLCAGAFPLGVLLETLNLGLGPQILAAAASGVVIVSLAGVVLGLSRRNEGC